MRTRPSLPIFIDGLRQDLRYAFRQLLHSPGFTSVAVITLALGIGVNTSIFSLLNALLLRPLPVPEPDRVVSLYRGNSRPCSYLDYLDLRDRNRSFSGLAANLPNESALDVGDTSTVILVEGVSYNYASVLATAPQLGRWFSPADDTPGHFSAVISHHVWQTRFGGDPHVLGRTVRLESQWYRVIGVAAPDFQGTLLPIRTALWVPLSRYAEHNDFAAAMTRNRQEAWVSVFGRLRPEVSLSRAAAEIQVLDAQLQKEHPRSQVRQTSLRMETARGVSNPRDRLQVSQLMILLMSVVSLVLLIACANLANLMLTRGLSRQHEMAIRLALGAGRFRLLRQTLVESLLLSLAGGAAGLLAAAWTNRWIETSLASVPFTEMIGVRLGLDWRVLTFTLFATILTTVLFGATPARRASRPDLVPAIKGAGPGRETGRRLGLRNLYAVAQVALSLMLVIVGGLFIRALQDAQRSDPGFDANRLVSARLYIAKPEFSDQTGAELYRRVQEHARRLPGVTNASLSYASAVLTTFDCVAPEGPAADTSPTRAASNVIGQGYFATMGIRLVHGREFTSADNSGAPAVVVVNEALARRYWPGQNPIERRVRVASGCAQGGGKSAEVVGVAKDARYASLDTASEPFIFVPFDQRFIGYIALVIRTAGDPAALTSDLRTHLQAIDSRLRIYEIETLSEQMDKALWAVRWQAKLLGGFAALALLIAAVGLYGVMAFAVRQRTREIGIRMAIGAQPSHVRWLVLGQGLTLTAAGIALGLTASLLLTRFLRGFLYGLSPTDNLTYLGAAILWMVVAAIGSFLPARRATRVDPVQAVRSE